MPLPSGALADPAGEELDLLGRQLLVRLGRRHDVVLIIGEKSRDQLAGFRVSRYDGGVLATRCAFVRVKSEVGFPGVFVRTVAVKAVVGKDGANVAIEGNLNISEGRLGSESGRGALLRARSEGGEHGTLILLFRFTFDDLWNGSGIFADFGIGIIIPVGLGQFR